MREVFFQTGDTCWFFVRDKLVEGKIGRLFPKTVDWHPQEYDVHAKGYHIYLDGLHLTDDPDKPIGLHRNG